MDVLGLGNMTWGESGLGFFPASLLFTGVLLLPSWSLCCFFMVGSGESNMTCA
jgi:hypothetical protein